jgi:hypothetical protein
MMGIIEVKIYRVKGALVAIITISNTMSESKNVTRLDNTELKAKIYLGTYNFLMVAPLVMIERKDAEVPAE